MNSSYSITSTESNKLSSKIVESKHISFEFTVLNTNPSSQRMQISG